MEITVNRDWRPEMTEDLPIEELAAFVISQEGKPSNTEVSISFVDDEEMTRLNEGYRHREGPTDVLSFECDNLDDDFSALEGSDEPYELGDIVIAVDVCERQTATYGTTFAEELELLITHGLLHLCGYDHIEDDEAAVMESREDELLKAWRARK